MKLLRVKQLPLFILFVALLQSGAAPAKAANTVDTGTVTWSCERDLSVKLNQKNGEFRVRMPSEKIDTTLHYAACNSSHCSWQQRKDIPGDTCYNEIGSGNLCLTITAGYKTQSLHIFSSAEIIVAECIAYKSERNWDEEPKSQENAAE